MASCPDLYTRITDQCFKVVLETLTWAQAQLACQDRGGKLAEPKDIDNFYEYMSDTTDDWETYWVGASKDRHGYWKWKSTHTIVDQNYWVESQSRAFHNPDSCAYVLPGYRKVGLHGGKCNNTYRYVCEVKTVMPEPAVLKNTSHYHPSESTPPTATPISIITSSAVISVAGVLAVFLLILMLFLFARKRLRNSKPNGQQERKDIAAVTNTNAAVNVADKSRLPNVIFIGDAPIYNDLVVDHPSGSLIPRMNVKLEDKSDEPHLKALLQCDREICEEDKLTVSCHLGLRWCEVGRRMKLSDGQIENIRADHPRSIDRAYELLTIWHDQESQKATVAKLAAILLQCNANSALCQLSI